MSPEQTQQNETTIGAGGALAAELQYEANSTRKMLERVPDEAFAWKPHEKSMSLGQLAQHVALIPTYAKPIFTTDEFDIASGDFKPPVLNNSAELVAAFDNALGEATQFLGTASEEDLTKTWRLRNGEKTIFEMPRAGVIRSMVLSHLIHHRGQLSVYLRLNDVPLPSVYGPTADEQ